MTTKLRVFFIVTAFEIIALLALYLHSRARLHAAEELSIPANRQIARELELTDLALWTEARYTRHPSQSDLFAPFQDLPSSLEHFPAGSIVVAPQRPVAPERARR